MNQISRNLTEVCKSLSTTDDRWLINRPRFVCMIYGLFFIFFFFFEKWRCFAAKGNRSNRTVDVSFFFVSFCLFVSPFTPSRCVGCPKSFRPTKETIVADWFGETWYIRTIHQNLYINMIMLQYVVCMYNTIGGSYVLWSCLFLGELYDFILSTWRSYQLLNEDLFSTF